MIEDLLVSSKFVGFALGILPDRASSPPACKTKEMASGIPSPEDVVRSACPDCWVEGCGPCNEIMGGCANAIEIVTPCLESISSAIWCLGSPLAFPLIFCFDSGEHTHESSGWKVSMLGAPCVRPLECCFATLCLPCGQWYVRYRALESDLSRYKLWQGYHDGPHCFARSCPGAPITITSGEYGESECPGLFLCLEVWILGGPCSSCCAFDVSRRLMRDERGLGMDPTEARQEKCVDFFYVCFRNITMIACCVRCAGCLAGCCAPDSEGAQEFSDAAGDGAGACWKIARTIHRGIWSVRILAIGCMSAQMIHEDSSRFEKGRGIAVAAPSALAMKRNMEE